MYKSLYHTILVSCMFLFFLKDEDPALRELAELEREGCLQDIQDLSQKVELSHFIKEGFVKSFTRINVKP